MLRPTVARSLVWSSATSVPCLFAAVACVLQGPHWGGAAKDGGPASGTLALKLCRQTPER
jgi:hypothetical protein